MELVINLQDHEEKSYRNLKIVLEDQATINQLQAKICSTFKIETDYQVLLHDDRRIDIQFHSSSTLLQIGLKDMDKVIVKHALLPTFVTFMKFLSMDTETLDEKRNIARKLHALKETLDSSKFFDVYITFDGDTTKQYTEWIRCLKYDPIVIMDSVKRLLGSLHLKYVPEKKQRNSNFGLVFDYSHDGTTESYYLKANETNWVTNPDARELIVYLLLQRIGIGPSKYYFIPGDAKLETVIYIATLKVPGFTMAKDLDNPLEEVAAVELHLLAIILNLIDPNTSDYGLDIHGSLTIVDFSLTKTYKDSACAMYFKEHVRRQPALVNLDKCPGWKRVMIGKEAMKRWNLEKVIEQTEEDFLKIKEELNKEVEFLDRASCGIKDYLESIKWNVQKLISDWDEDSSQ